MNRRHFICSAIVAVAVGKSGAAFASQAKMTVYKDPTCGCCGAWADAIAEADIAVDVQEVSDLDGIKRKYGVPKELEGCHTAILGSYVVEGHVPLEAVEKLISDQPEIAGLAVAGMPRGSLGMGTDPNASYDVVAFKKDGSSEVYMRVRPKG
ncbi:DUF411 domain-containing protein [Rhizobium sp. LC145]|uniref:DUF411 domain-containing protein n=1 Tax=Rhizobium sp. LC145 TaxID=1120688 RepID=UPI00062A14D8|nr:DUF411 domain-containing protein [Rhizobium sp. LC145]KKX29424.1 hypothetical protein YH62_16790 [Rhizobium sp. LC145]MDX3927963.1 DUF411 domain-containing protein [Shinella sp.]TKT66199.1 DUF411 domain-containing protein [Rhizobiaceae bacterium LC148]